MSSSQKKHQRKHKHVGKFSFQEKMVLCLCVCMMALLAWGLKTQDFSARSTPTTFTTPPIFGEKFDDCNLGLIDSCNDSGQYIEGPESILENWFFSKAIPWWLSFFLVLAAGVSVLMIMAGGIMVTTGADTDVRQKGVKTIIWAVCGLLIILFAFTIIAILENLPLPGSTAPLPEA